MTIEIILLILIYILNIIDYFQTVYAIQLFGIGVEINPIGRFMLSNNCAWAFKFIGVALILTAIGFIIKYDKKQSWAVYFLLIVFLFLVIHNFYQLAQVGIFSFI